MVIEWEGFEGRCRDESGKVWKLFRTQIEPGLFLYLDGEKCAESHPKFAEFMRSSLADNIARLRSGSVDSPALERLLEDNISRTRWYLERNGFDPDQPPSGPTPQITAQPRNVASNPRMPTNAEPRRMRS